MTVGLSNYDELKDAVKDWLGRGGVSDPIVEKNINVFVNLTEEEITTNLKLLGIKRVLSGRFETGNPVIEKPQGWRSTISWRTSVSPVMFQRTTDYIKMVYTLGSEGPPKYYSDYDYTHWYVGPTPDEEYNFEVEMYGMPKPLSSEVPTNWYLDRTPHALLYGSLQQAFMFLKNSQSAAIWQAKFKEALGGVKTEDLGTMVSESQRKPK